MPQTVRFGVVGDIHGEFDALDRIMRERTDVAFWLSVGDVASPELRYPDPVSPLYWIKGNNEDFAFVAQLQAGRSAGRLRLLPNGRRQGIEGVTVAGLGGTLAPTWYDTPANRLPYPDAPGMARVRDDKRRHFVREEVDACKAMDGVDVFLTHEAPRPFIVVAGGRRIDAGKTPVNEVLASMKPRLHFFGHHHRFTDSIRSGVRSIGLDLVTQSFVVVDAPSFSVQVDTP